MIKSQATQKEVEPVWPGDCLCLGDNCCEKCQEYCECLEGKHCKYCFKGEMLDDELICRCECHITERGDDEKDGE